MQGEMYLDVPSPMDWQTLQVIYKFQQGEQLPTLREIAQALGLRAVSAARVHVLRLGELGLVTHLRVGKRRYSAARTLRVTAKGKAALERYAAWMGSGLVCGKREVRLTDAQYRKLKHSDVPLSSFRQRAEGRYTIVVFGNWRERDYWAGEMLTVLGEKNGK